jgi:hypothetical protein
VPPSQKKKKSKRKAIRTHGEPYVGVIAQEVQAVMPKAVVRDRDGSLRVFYDWLGIKFQTYEEWVTSGARLPTVAPALH